VLLLLRLLLRLLLLLLLRLYPVLYPLLNTHHAVSPAHAATCRQAAAWLTFPWILA
jgi:hypothetical protein